MNDADSQAVLDGVKAVRLIYPTRCLIMEDGTLARFTDPVSMNHAHSLLHAGALDTVILKDRKHVMLVDDASQAKRLPVNALACAHYYDKCGAKVPFEIRGPVLIVPDADYVQDEALRGMY